MDEIEDKLNAVLNNPKMMQQIMSIAQSMGGNQNPEASTHEGTTAPPIDLGMLQKLSGFAQQSGIDKDQQTLLRALGPYLSRERISKLEKAMRAARIARLASGFIGSAAP